VGVAAADRAQCAAQVPLVHVPRSELLELVERLVTTAEQDEQRQFGDRVVPRDAAARTVQPRRPAS